MHASALRLSLVVGLASALCACGGGGGSSSGGGGTPTPPVSNASPGGIWQGIDPISRLPVYALAAEDGRFQLIVDDAAPVTQYWGTLVTSGNSLSSSNIHLAKGPTYLGTATITGGSLTARQSMTASVSFTPAPGCAVAVCGGPQSGTLSLSFNPVYNQGGALSRITGNWPDAFTGQIININSAGVLFAQEVSTGCITNEQNGTTATGLAFVDTSVTPNRAYFAGQYRVGNTAYSVYGAGPKVGG